MISFSALKDQMKLKAHMTLWKVVQKQEIFLGIVIMILHEM